MPVPINVVSCAPQLLFVPYQPLPVISPSKLTSQLEIASVKSHPLPSCQMLPTFQLVAILTLMSISTVHTRNSTLLLSCNKDSKKPNWPLMQISTSFAPRSKVTELKEKINSLQQRITTHGGERRSFKTNNGSNRGRVCPIGQMYCF